MLIEQIHDVKRYLTYLYLVLAAKSHNQDYKNTKLKVNIPYYLLSL